MIYILVLRVFERTILLHAYSEKGQAVSVLGDIRDNLDMVRVAHPELLFRDGQAFDIHKSLSRPIKCLIAQYLSPGTDLVCSIASMELFIDEVPFN